MRPWVLTSTHSNSRVPLLMNLDLILLPELADATSDPVPPVLRTRRRKKNSIGTVDWRQRSYSTAWRRYIMGNVVSDHQARLIQNFLLVMAGTGKHEREDDDEEGLNTRRRREDLGEAGRKFEVHEIKSLLKPSLSRGGPTLHPGTQEADQ